MIVTFGAEDVPPNAIGSTPSVAFTEKFGFSKSGMTGVHFTGSVHWSYFEPSESRAETYQSVVVSMPEKVTLCTDAPSGTDATVAERSHRSSKYQAFGLRVM